MFKDINTGELKDEIEGLPVMPIDLAVELEQGFTTVKSMDYSRGKEDYLMSRLPHTKQAVLKKGWFPETAFDIEDETFALVYIRWNPQSN